MEVATIYMSSNQLKEKIMSERQIEILMEHYASLDTEELKKLEHGYAIDVRVGFDPERKRLHREHLEAIRRTLKSRENEE